jgi:arylsulfatase A-like enzyme
MIALIDDQLARIIQRLDETGQRENTIIIFTSDHGESLGDHGLLLKGCRFYDGLVRVPLIFNCPGSIKANLRSDALVELLDMSATILDFAGIGLPEYFQGSSLRPILGGNAPADHHRDSIRSEYFDALDKKFCNGNASFATMYRDRRYKLVVYHRDNLGELFDLEADPYEFENLWDDPAFAEIRHRLILESFNDHVMKTTDVGSRRIAPM